MSVLSRNTVPASLAAPPQRLQTGQQLLAEIIWEDLAANKPSWLPTVNPYNSEILAIFGDQGGY